MPKVEGSVVIGRPVEDVFNYIADPTNSTKFETGVVVNELTSDGALGVGSKGRRVQKFMGTDEGNWEITEWEPNKTMADTFESGRFAGQVRWDLAAEGAGTHLSYKFQMEPRTMLWKVLVPLTVSMFRRQTRGDYARLKRLLESGS